MSERGWVWMIGIAICVLFWAVVIDALLDWVLR